MRTSLADKIVDDGVDRLYRDDTYAVVRTPRGRTYVVQRVPPYVVEGIDKKLYYFDGVDIGLLVRACSRVTCSRRSVCRCLRNTVTCSSTVSATTSVCRDQAYFRELEGMPLAEGTLQHLEAARMTLCAGYMPQNAVMHPVDGVGRREVSLEEARRRWLPIYWYYKPRRSLAARMRSLID